MGMNRTRRRFLEGSASVLSAGVAGCLATGQANLSSNQRTAQASFYLLYDIARNVAGPSIAVESVVPFGQHGHGWDGPTAGQQRELLTSDLFVYVGDGFQPWADRVVETIREDGAPVETVRAHDGIDLLEYDGVHDDHGEGETNGGDDHDQASDAHGENDGHDPHDGDESANEVHGPNHGDHDPHFWLDPRRTGRAVENLRDGMIAVDSVREKEYLDRAAAYIRDLDELHLAFVATLSGANKDAVFVAGHNAFGYLEAAYGFEVFSLTGISPDEAPSASARRNAETIIDEYEIEYILHPVLEPRTLADQLVADTDARGVLDVTAISGVTDAWVADDMGYLDLMRSINLPSFAQALGAE